jgi:hypothetical protein
VRLRHRRHKERNNREPRNKRDLSNNLRLVDVLLSNHNASNVRLAQRKLNVRLARRSSSRGVNA